jgi:hypothetical protein
VVKALINQAVPCVGLTGRGYRSPQEPFGLWRRLVDVGGAA